MISVLQRLINETLKENFIFFFFICKKERYYHIWSYKLSNNSHLYAAKSSNNLNL